MSSLTVVQSKSSNNYKAATSFKSHTFASACTPGNSVVLIITALTEELPFFVEPEVGVGTFYPMALIATDTSTAGMTRFLYKLDNLLNAATSIRYKVNAASGNTQQASTAWEIGNTGGSALSLRANQKTSKTSNTSFSENFTTVSANELVLVNLRENQNNPATAATAPFSTVTRANGNINDLYQADMGAAGSKFVEWTTGSSVTASVWITSFSNTSVAPTVTSVTGSTITEGAGGIVYSIALSGTTSSDASYPSSFTGGTATVDVDYDSALANATFGTGVTYSGSNVVIQNGYSGGTVTFASIQDLLDEDNETVVWTVGGVASTGASITDNDAPPVVTFRDGVESFGVVTCVATLGAVSGKDVSFQVDTTNGTKTAGTNYTAIVAQTVTIPAGSLTAAITANTL